MLELISFKRYWLSSIGSWLKKGFENPKENKIKKEGKITDNEIYLMKEKIISEIEDAFLFAKESPFPNHKMLNHHIYKE